MRNRERLTLGLLLASIFAIRAIHPDQPIVENYVGRQIPTAMVARNLERGGSFLRPRLDTGPSPNLFLVEPPIYAEIVALLKPVLGIQLEPLGRLVSAAAVVLAGWGLFGLVRRREGLTIAFIALASFGLFPVMIRYGRAFQPDALMVGCVLAGLRGWDEYEANGNRRWAIFGGFVLAIGLALKITVAWALIPFFVILQRWGWGWRILISIVMLVPAGLWYLHAWQSVTSTGLVGSTASRDNADLWMNALSLSPWLRFSTYESLGIGLGYRSFTPIGFVLVLSGWLACGKVDRLWVGWAVGCGLSIVGLATKWHHAYYWMVVAPLAAVGVGRGLVHLSRLAQWGRPLAYGLGSFLLAMCLYQSVSTFQTPAEWTGLLDATRSLERIGSNSSAFAAAEAVVYYADLPGNRLEFDPNAMKRAAGEHGFSMKDASNPLALVEFYRDLNTTVTLFQDTLTVEELHRAASTSRKQRDRLDFQDRGLLVADVGLTDHEPRRRAWREAIRKRPNTKILEDKPGYLIALLR